MARLQSLAKVSGLSTHPSTSVERMRHLDPAVVSFSSLLFLRKFAISAT
jgi:hypothetical protein